MTQLVTMTDAERGALQLRLDNSASAAAGIANLARGGRGGTSLPPERIRGLAKPTPSTSWTIVILLLVVLGSLGVALVYSMHKR